MPSSCALSSTSERGQDRRGWARLDCKVKADGKARQPEKDPEPAAQVRSKQLERDREERDPGRRHKRKDSVDPERDQRPSPRHVELDAPLDREIVEMPRVVDHDSRPGREGRPVRVDDFAFTFDQRVDDESNRHREHCYGSAPAPAISH
jgi:hypothetical protein